MRRIESLADRSAGIGNASKLGFASAFVLTALVIASLLVAPHAAATPGTRTSGTFPTDTFNGMQITYSVSGAILDTPVDTSDFTTSRVYAGNLTAGSLTLSGSVYMDWGSVSTTTSASVEVNGEKDKWWANKTETTSGTVWQQSFSVDIPIPSGARSGSFMVSMSSLYGNGETRGLVVRGSLTVPALNVAYLTLSQDENEVQADPSLEFDLRAVVFADGQQVPDGTVVTFTLSDWDGDLAGARIEPETAGTLNSAVTVSFVPPGSAYWDSHDASAGISNRITVTASCGGKEASVNIVIVADDSGDGSGDGSSDGDGSGDGDDPGGDGGMCGSIILPLALSGTCLVMYVRKKGKSPGN
ncbi:MAG: hypothetical protein V1934_05370 [Methanobacteriota archaeon]